MFGCRDSRCRSSEYHDLLGILGASNFRRKSSVSGEIPNINMDQGLREQKKL